MITLPRSASAATHASRLVLLALAAAGLFGSLLRHPAQVLYSDHSDLVAMHLPRKEFLVREYQRRGELPRWCPYEFCGTPFLHDIQVAAFYPPHAILLALRPAAVGAALSWLLAGHVLLAGWLMYGYAWREGCSADGALVAGAGYMLGGKWLLHMLSAGHYILIGLAWLPGLVWLMSQAVRRASAAHTVAAGGLFSLMLLGTQPQWTFYSGLLAAGMTLLAALEPHPARPLARRLAIWLGSGLAVVAIGCSLAAVQLLPTWEYQAETVRGSAGVHEGKGWLGTLLVLVKLVGPGLKDRKSVV